MNVCQRFLMLLESGTIYQHIELGELVYGRIASTAAKRCINYIANLNHLMLFTAGGKFFDNLIPKSTGFRVGL